MPAGTAHRLAIEAAARGLVSGRLREWPVLASALAAAGAGLSPDAGAGEMRRAARAVLREEGSVGASGNCCEHCDQTSGLTEQVSAIREKMAMAVTILERLDKTTVNRSEFAPVRAIAFGFVAVVLGGFAAALAAGVFK